MAAWKANVLNRRNLERTQTHMPVVVFPLMDEREEKEEDKQTIKAVNNSDLYSVTIR